MGATVTLTAEAKYELLRDISYQVRTTLDLDEILNHLLDRVETLVGCDAAGIFVLNRDIAGSPYRSELGLIAGIVRRGYDERPTSEDPMYMLGEGIIGHVIRTGVSVVIPDVRKDSRYIAGRIRTQSEIAVPIVRNDQPIGALNLESDALGAFDESDIDILQFIADAASISIEKSLLHAQILENRRIENQLRIAAEIQSQLLPARPPEMAGYDIAGLCIPTHAIGGDYYDYIPLGSGKFGIIIADVSGDGIPAALLMTSFRAVFLSYVRRKTDLHDLMRDINRQLPEFMRRRDFVTALYGILDTGTHMFSYVNCGHHPPILCRFDGTIEAREHGGPSFNLLPDHVYRTSSVHLNEGDRLVLFTDGVTEVFNEHREEFGLSRLEDILRRQTGQSSSTIIDTIVESTRAFSGTSLYRDDFTLVAVKRKRGKEKP